MRGGSERRVVAIAPAVAQSVEINARSLQNLAQLAFVLRERLRFSEMRRQSAVDSSFDFSGVFDQPGADREIVRSRSLPLILESPVRPAAFDADGKVFPLNAELEAIRIAPAVAERVNVNGLARHQFALQSFAVVDESAGLRIMIFDRSRDGRGGVVKVLPRFAESGEVIIGVEAFVRPRGDHLEYVVDGLG